MKDSESRCTELFDLKGSYMKRDQSIADYSGLAGLCAIARFHEIPADPAKLAHQLGLASATSPDTQLLLRAAKHLGLKARLIVTSVERLVLTALPALALVCTPEGSIRTVVLSQTDGAQVLLQYPGSPVGAAVRTSLESIETFNVQWTGELIVFTG